VTDDPTSSRPIAGIDDTAPIAGFPSAEHDALLLPSTPPTAGLAPFALPPLAASVPDAPPSRSLSKWTWALVGLGVVAVFAGIVIVSTTDFAASSVASTPPIGTVVTPTDGVPFTDPQGTYTIDLAPNWTKLSGAPAKEIEAWQVALHSGGFTPNVTVLTQDSQGMNLGEYMDFSNQHLGGTHLDYSTTVTGIHGNQLGVIEYDGIVPGASTSLHFLAVVDVRNGQAIVATLTSSESRFATLRTSVEPYLRSLQAT
jgi:hypothetical protein